MKIRYDRADSPIFRIQDVKCGDVFTFQGSEWIRCRHSNTSPNFFIYDGAVCLATGTFWPASAFNGAVTPRDAEVVVK